MAVIHRSFAGGELAPALHARTDQSKYATGLALARNLMVLRGGGVANRAGTRFVGEVKDSATRTRLLRFAFNAAESYLLEVGAGYLRILAGGGFVTTADAPAWADGTVYVVGDLVRHGDISYYCTVAHTAVAATHEPGTGSSWQSVWYRLTGHRMELPTPYRADELMAIRTVQSADVLTIVHPAHPPRELRRYGHTRWVLADVRFGPDSQPPVAVTLTGGAAGSERSWAVTTVGATGEESLPLIVSALDRVPSAEAPTVLAWDPITGALEYQVYRSLDGKTFGYIGTAGGVLRDEEDTSWASTTSDVTTTLRGQWVRAGDAAANEVVTTPGGKAVDGRYRITGHLLVQSDGSGPAQAVSGAARIYYRRDGGPRVDAGTTPIAVATGGGDRVVPFSHTIIVPDSGYTTLVVELVAEVLGEGDQLAEATCAVTATAVLFRTGALGFTDEGQEADYAIGPPSHPALFDAAGEFPATVAFHQQRRAFASTERQPETCWLSRVGHFQSFSRSRPLQDDDAVQFTAAGREVNAIRHLVDLGRLVVLTSAGEWVVEGNDAGVVTPGGVNLRQHSYNGSAAHPAPVLVVNTALYVQARGTVVRDFFPDQLEGFKGGDLTIFASHLFDGHTIEDWDYAAIPHSIVWAVRDDGVLLGLTYIREHQIAGWHRHDTLGHVENVCVVPEGSEDVLYLVVRRTIAGQERRYIERMASRQYEDITDAWFVDSGLAYDGWHRGQTTLTLAAPDDDWSAETQLTVTASAPVFAPADEGNGVVLEDAQGQRVRCRINGVTSDTEATVVPHRDVPPSLRGAPAARWALAVDELAGLEHLEGQAVSVLGDGFVVASPHNNQNELVTVTDGRVQLDRPYAKLVVGLPYLADLQTLPLDYAGDRTIRDKHKAVTRVGIHLLESRGVFAGRRFPTGDDALAGLSELQIRRDEGYDDPVAPATGVVHLNIDSTWDNNGQVVVRQVDPLPVTVLAIIPQGFVQS